MRRGKRTPELRASEQSKFDRALLDNWRTAVEMAATQRSDYPFCPGQMHWRAVLDAAAQLAEAERAPDQPPRRTTSTTPKIPVNTDSTMKPKP